MWTIITRDLTKKKDSREKSSPSYLWSRDENQTGVQTVWYNLRMEDENIQQETVRVRKKCELLTIADVREWCSRPENQIRTALFIVKWDGCAPLISVAPTDRLRAVMDDNEGLARAILVEHLRRRKLTSEELYVEE